MKKKMKMERNDLLKAFVILILAVFPAMNLNAQSRNDVVKAFNEGAKVVQTDPQAAINAFENVVSLSAQVGDSAADLRDQAVKVLPSLYYKLAANAYSAKKPAAEVIEASKKAGEMATKYNNPSVKKNADIILVNSYSKLAGECFAKNNYDGALAAFDNVLAVTPDNMSIVYNKALIYIKQGNSNEFEKTIDLYISKMKEANDEAKLKQASTLALEYYRAQASKADQAEKLDDALALLDKAAKYGEDKDMYYYYAEVYNKKKDFDKGLESGQKGLAMETGDAAAKAKFYFQIGLAQEGKKMTAEACESFKNASYGIFEAPSKAKRTNLKCN